VVVVVGLGVVVDGGGVAVLVVEVVVKFNNIVSTFRMSTY
jgi:hypothetical protein